MAKASCESDTSWTNSFDATVSLAIYQRTATVVYDRSNSSILSVSSLTDPIDVSNEDLLNDFQAMFEVMYPKIDDITQVLEGFLTDIQTVLNDLSYWASVYCVQSELSSAQLFLKNGFPTWITHEQDLLEGFIMVPVQFATLLWQWVEISNLQALPASLHTTASSASVSQRARSEPWTVITFAVLTLSLVLWAAVCLLYAHLQNSREVHEEHDPTVAAGFRRGNPFDVDDSIWGRLWGIITWIACCGRHSPSTSDSPGGSGTGDDVVARKAGENEMLIAVGRLDG